DENVGAGPLAYPVLMASLSVVPAGADRKQHMELTCEPAERVNYLYGGTKWKKMDGS
ncbi:hypothetical protein MKX03_015629, partial [Papaver bracteatum]